IVPEPPYFQGRFSNGPVWADYFADVLGTNATASLLGGTNYAWGGARTTEVAFGFIPPITAQVGAYLEDVGFVADPNALYVFQNAENDKTVAALEDPETAKQIMQEAVEATELMLGDLFDAGARNFMLLTLPEKPTEPVSAVLPDGTNLAQMTNEGFAEFAADFEAMGARVWLVDLNGLVDDVVNDPDRFGFEVVRCSFMGKSGLAVIAGDMTPEPCEPSVPVDGYMMFDDEHYTTRMHNILSYEALGELCAGEWPTVASPDRACIVVPDK
ncbi:MAG: SGNH/GDSL hydrolase family protein, partial [Phycisphaerae bacterium]|nr:SGNH/GDSL hydrolase family protein [Phycisphaerae bacterium]